MAKTAVRVFVALFTTLAFITACNNAVPSLALFDITSGKVQVNPGDLVDFLTAYFSPADPRTRTFSVENSGTADLSLTGAGSRVVVSGANASYFTIPVQPPQSVPAGGSVSFDVVFTATGSNSPKFATIGIDSDDPDLASLSFDVTGYDQNS